MSRGLARLPGCYKFERGVTVPRGSDVTTTSGPDIHLEPLDHYGSLAPFCDADTVASQGIDQDQVSIVKCRTHG